MEAEASDMVGVNFASFEAQWPIQKRTGMSSKKVDTPNHKKQAELLLKTKKFNSVSLGQFLCILLQFTIILLKYLTITDCTAR